MTAVPYPLDHVSLDRERIRIRAARRDDLDGLAALDAWAWPAGARRPTDEGAAPFSTRYNLSDLTVALAGGRHIGFIAVSRRSRCAANSHVGLLRALLVATDYRACGVGSALLAAAETWARARGFMKIDAHVLQGDRPAEAFFGKAGFSVEGRLRGEYRIGDRLVDDLHLAKWLSAPAALAQWAEARRERAS